MSFQGMVKSCQKFIKRKDVSGQFYISFKLTEIGAMIF